MLQIYNTVFFSKQLKKIKKEIKLEAIEKIELFKDEKNHQQLKVHKLKGRLQKRFSFSVNYKIRIIFQYSKKNKNEVVLLSIGDHSIYN